MIRRIIKINEGLCNGCGACAAACHEGAIGMVDGKAVLLKDDYCDGLGDCLPTCPTGAITFEEREAAAYDEAAVKARMAGTTKKRAASPLPADVRVPSPGPSPGPSPAPNPRLITRQPPSHLWKASCPNGRSKSSWSPYRRLTFRMPGCS